MAKADRANWNGIDSLTSDQILELSRPSAAHWWREAIDPDGVGPITTEEIEHLARELHLSIEALCWAANCAGAVRLGGQGK